MICSAMVELLHLRQDTSAWLGHALDGLVSVTTHGESAFVNLPMFFPSGTAATVRIDRAPGGFRVSDNGFTYRVLESIGAERSFASLAKSTSEKGGLEKNRRCLFATVSEDDLSRAISDIAAASWKIVDKVFSDYESEAEDELELELQAKLVSLFGEEHVHCNETLRGASSSE